MTRWISLGVVVLSVSLADARVCRAGETVEGIVARCTGKVLTLRSLAGEVEYKHTAVSQPGVSTSTGGNRTARIKFRMAEGERFAVRVFDGDTLSSAAMSDGQTVYEYEGKTKRWTSYPLAWRSNPERGWPFLGRDGAVVQPGLSGCWLDAATYHDWLAGLLGSGQFTLQPSAEESAKQWVFVAKQTQHNGPATVEERAHLALNRATGLPEAISLAVTITMPGIGKVSDQTSTWSWTHIELNPPIAKDGFSWHAPEGSTEVDVRELLPNAPTAIGKQVADVTVRMADGKAVQLSQLYKDRTLVVVFWATWCLPCKLEMSELPSLRNEFSEDKVAFLGINVDKSEQTATAFLKKHPQPVPVAFEPDGKLRAILGDSTLIPQTFIIGSDGEVKDALVGWGTGRIEAFRKRLRDILR